MKRVVKSPPKKMQPLPVQVYRSWIRLQGQAVERITSTAPGVALERACGAPEPELHPCRPAHQVDAQWFHWMRANDPSAGSPTETLLRLLLPLSDKVH